MIRLALIFWLALMAGPLMAVEPGEMLADPDLEARARGISQGLRCPVCRNENIDESNAGVSADLRRLVRERLLAGDSDAEVRAFVVARYGEFVLLEPTRDGSNLALWLAGPAMLVIALGGGLLYLRRRGRSEGPEALDEAEAARLEELLRE